MSDPSTDDVERDLKDRILLAVLPQVPFEGWSHGALRVALSDLGEPETTGQRLFPDSARDLIAHWSDWTDRQMQEALSERDLYTMTMAQRIAAALNARLEANEPYREAVRRALSFLTLPVNTALAARLTYKSVNAIWYACGDTTTSFSFYTKRGTLAAVFLATTLYWLEDTSDDGSATRAFIDRRIADITRLPRMRARMKGLRLPRPHFPFSRRHSQAG